MKKLIVLLLVLGAGAASAAPVTWMFDNVLLDDGGTVTGSFVYDAALNQYSSIDILTTAGSTLPGNHYFLLFAVPPYDVSGQIAFFFQSDVADKTGVPVLGMVWGGRALTDAGGSLEFSFLVETFCGDANCAVPSGQSRDVLSGSLTAVPIPAAVWLFGSSLGLLAWLRRRPLA